MSRVIVATLLLTLSCCDPVFAGALERAQQYLPIYREVVSVHWPQMPMQHIPCGQVEQESSWKATATLKTPRELGRGLTQMTVAYNKDGSERFNIYREAVKWRALKGWNWRQDPYNVQYQLTFLVLQDQMNYAVLRPLFINEEETWKAALVSYNAGRGRVMSRLAVARARESPADRWTSGLDQAHGPKEDRILYGRPLWQAVNEYPVKVFRRAEKYRGK